MKKYRVTIYTVYKDEPYLGTYSCFLCAWFVARLYMLQTTDWDDREGRIDEEYTDEKGRLRSWLVSVVKKDSLFPKRTKVGEWLFPPIFDDPNKENKK